MFRWIESHICAPLRVCFCQYVCVVHNICELLVNTLAQFSHSFFHANMSHLCKTISQAHMQQGTTHTKTYRFIFALLCTLGVYLRLDQTKI